MRRKKGNVLYKYTLNTFYLWLCGFGHMVNDHSNGLFAADAINNNNNNINNNTTTNNNNFIVNNA